MIRFALVLLVLLACSAGATAAELTLLPGAPLTPEAVADMVAADLRARGVGGQVAVEVSSPRPRSPTGRRRPCGWCSPSCATTSGKDATTRS